MSLADDLSKIYKGAQQQIPKEVEIFDADTKEMIGAGIDQHSLQIEDFAPDFTLPDQLGRAVHLSDLLDEGPVILNFYRGRWCPYCNLELSTLQLFLPDIEELGASLVAISPQKPDESLSTADKNNLDFPVLSDVGNEVARQFGLVFTVSEHIRPLYKALGVDLPQFNGTETFELPIPGTFILDAGGIIQGMFVNADYKQRMEPTEIIAILSRI